MVSQHELGRTVTGSVLAILFLQYNEDSDTSTLKCLSCIVNHSMATRRTKAADGPPPPIQTYGCPKQLPNQFYYDCWAFAKRIPIDQGAPTRIELFKRISGKFLPGHFEWHDWTYRINETLCDNPIVGLPGCSNSAKTFNVMGFAVTWWLCAPDASSVTIVSTSIKSLRRRGWAEIQKCHTAIPGPRFGNFVDSRMIWAAKRGDDKHAIIGKAVEEGSVTKVADDIKGVHTRRQMVIIDEATAVPEAIYDACGNLYSYPEEFILVAIGNPRNRLDQFGRFCEPMDGWTSVNVETGEWDSAPIPYIGGKSARIVTFDAEKSPNIVEGKIVSRHLPTREKVEAARNSAGGQTPNYWSNFRGFWPPEGLSKTVFSESALIANDGYGRHIFTGRHFSIIGMFDPAFGGGDRPALRFAKLGETENGKWGIEVFKPIIIPVDARSKNPVHYQLAEQLRRQCESFNVNGQTYSCPPENLAVDATGEGGGLCDIINRTWSPNIIRIEFGGKSSEDAASLEDIRPACEVYENKRVEIYFRARNALNSGQLKGIDKETALEVCTLEFDDSGKRIKLQKKADYKEKFGKSPDLGDCLAGLTEVARRRGFQLAAVGHTVNRFQDWEKEVNQAQEVFATVDYTPEEDYAEAV